MADARIAYGLAKTTTPGQVPNLPGTSDEATDYVLLAENRNGVIGMAWREQAIGAGSIVASASGRNTDDESLSETPLYTVPDGKAGLYRITGFCGPASLAGSGQVNVLARWPAYGSGLGNLGFMRPGEAGSYQLATFTIGESSSVGVGQELIWWAAEGAVIGYEVQSSFDGGSWVWGVSLERLA